VLPLPRRPQSPLRFLPPRQPQQQQRRVRWKRRVVVVALRGIRRAATAALTQQPLRHVWSSASTAASAVDRFASKSTVNAFKAMLHVGWPVVAPIVKTTTTICRLEAITNDNNIPTNCRGSSSRLYHIHPGVVSESTSFGDCVAPVFEESS
jgi:hypothetical protein